MPQYIFQNPITQEITEVIQGINEPHVLKINGVEWVRVWTIPQASIDTKINPESSSDFVNKTRNKKGSVGDLWAASDELSKKRENVYGGKDPVKDSYIKRKKKESGGKKHYSEIVAAKNKTYEIEIKGNGAKLNSK